MTKTNAMRLLEKGGVPYRAVEYDLDGAEFSGEAVARLLGVPAGQVFKTLTARGGRLGVLVFVVPAGAELDLKRAAAAAGDKRVELLPVRELLPVTGYVRGEVSPLGMRRKYPAFIDSSALEWGEILVSAGRGGCSLAVEPRGLARLLQARFF